MKKSLVLKESVEYLILNSEIKEKHESKKEKIYK